MPAKIIGRVSVRVSPDTSEFPEELRRKLREMNDPEVPVKATVDPDQAMRELRVALAKLQAKADRDPIEIDTRIDNKDLADQLSRVGDDFELKLSNDESVKQLGRDLDEVRRDADRTQDAIDRMVRPRMFQPLQKAIDDTRLSMTKYHDRIEQIADETKALARLEAQRSKALDDMAKQAQKTRDAELKANQQRIKDWRQFEQGFRGADRQLAKMVERLRAAGQIDLAQEYQNKRFELKARITPDLSREAMEDIAHEGRRIKDQLEDELDDIEAQIQPDVQEAGYRRAQQRLAWLARSRLVQLIPAVNRAAAAKALTALAALSGARMIGENLKNLRDFFKDLDKNLPKIALLATGFLNLASSVLAGSSNLFALSSSLAQIFPIALALPGIFAGMALGLTALIVPLLKINKELPELKKAWDATSKAMTKNFWAEAKAPLQELVNNLMPEFQRGMEATATEMGQLVGTFGQLFSRRMTAGPMKQMFADLAQSIHIAESGAGAMVEVITILGEKGAGLLPRLSQYFVNLTEKFANFLSIADANGSLDFWIERAIERIKELGKVIYEAGRIFGGLGRAAEAAGGSTLKTLGDVLRDIADVVNSNGFQNQLVDTFAAAHKAMSNIADISGPAVYNLFKTLARTLETVLPVAGEIAGTILRDIADALSQTAMQRGIIDLFDGIKTAVQLLSPAFGPLGEALGNVLTLIGDLAVDFAPLLEVALSTISEMFIALAPAISDTASALSGGLLSVFKALAPVLVDLAEQLAPVLVMIGEQLGGILAENAPAIAEFARTIGEFLVTAFTDLAPVVLQTLDALLPLALELGTHLLQAVIDLLPYIVQLADQLIQQIIPAAIEAAPRVMEFVDSLVLFLQNLMPLLGPLVEFGGQLLLISTAHLPVLSGALQLAAGNLDQFMVILGGLPAILAVIGSAFFDMWEQIYQHAQEAFMRLVGEMPQWAQEIIAGIIGVLTVGPAQMAEAMRNIANAIIDTFKSVLGIHSPSTVMAAAGNDVVAGLIQGISERIGDAATKAGQLAKAVRDVFTNSGEWLKPPGVRLISGLISGMGSKQSDATGRARTIRDAIKDVFSGARDLLYSAGENIARGLASGISAGRSWVTGAAERVASAARRAAEWILDINSPSRVFHGIGAFVSLGLAEGIESKTSTVVRAVESLADAMNGVDLAIEPSVDLDYAEKQLATATKSIKVEGEAGSVNPADAVSKQFIFNTYNPVEEPQSVTTNKALQLLAALGEE